MNTNTPEWHRYMRRLMNAKDADPGHQIGMQVWSLSNAHEVSDYLDEVIIGSSRAGNDARLKVAKRLKELLSAGGAS